jgi:hypothetical protein
MRSEFSFSIVTSGQMNLAGY